MSALSEQHTRWTEAQGRLRALPAPKRIVIPDDPRPVAAHVEDLWPAIKFEAIMRMVEEDHDIPRRLIVSGGYCAAIAARHTVFCMLVDAGFSYVFVAGQFGMDSSSVRLAVMAFRRFEAEKGRAA